MNFKQLLSKYSFDEFWSAFEKQWPECSKEAHRSAWDELMTTEPTDSKGMVIHFKMAKEDPSMLIEGDDPDKEHPDVSGIDGSVYSRDQEGHEHLPDDMIGTTITWAIEMRPWPQFLAMEISEDSFKHGELFALVHIFYEVTFMGFDNDTIQGKHDELVQQVKDIKDGKVELIPWEDVKKSLTDKLEKLNSSIDDND